MAPVLFISAAADFWNRGDDGVELLILGLVVGLIGLAVLGVSRFPSGLPVARLFVAFVAGAFASLIVATAAHYFSSAVTSLMSLSPKLRQRCPELTLQSSRPRLCRLE